MTEPELLEAFRMSVKCLIKFVDDLRFNHSTLQFDVNLINRLL